MTTPHEMLRQALSSPEAMSSLLMQLGNMQDALQSACEAINRDRSGMAKALEDIKREIQGRLWVTEGRGAYEWDDERYKAEAGDALHRVLLIADDALIASGRLADEEFKKALAALENRSEIKTKEAKYEMALRHVHDFLDEMSPGFDDDDAKEAMSIIKDVLNAG